MYRYSVLVQVTVQVLVKDAMRISISRTNAKNLSTFPLEPTQIGRPRPAYCKLVPLSLGERCQNALLLRVVRYPLGATLQVHRVGALNFYRYFPSRF